MRSLSLLCTTLFVCLLTAAQSPFDAHFNGKRLRIDFTLSGNADMQTAALTSLYEEPLWSGPRGENLIDPFGYGEYLLEVYDKADKKLIYSTGLNTLFEEWRTTQQARKETQSQLNSITIPYPHQTITALLLTRSRNSAAADHKDTLMRLDIDPASIFIDRSPRDTLPVTRLQTKGSPSNKTDLVFLAEGYTLAEKAKFTADAGRFTETLFATPPFDRCREDFNIYAVFPASKESGTDLSGMGIFKNTALNTGFYTFGTDRYLTTPDLKSLRNAVWNLPCDAIILLVNSEIYGGGGMYNLYAVATADNVLSAQVFIHEFGHSFAGLADEYVSSETSTTYTDFHNTRLEPWNPNITTLVDFDGKWKDLLPSGAPVPTPPEAPYTDGIGVFEGGGYRSKGIYRPATHCMMRDLTPFCPVCTRSILRRIDYWSDRKIRTH
jgi:hypothetical protein